MQPPVEATTCTTIAAMTLMEDAITSALFEHSTALQPWHNEALLHLAVKRIVAADGQDHAASVLWRMAELLACVGPNWRTTSRRIRRLSR